jgi:hypothetical protein
MVIFHHMKDWRKGLKFKKEFLDHIKEQEHFLQGYFIIDVFDDYKVELNKNNVELNVDNDLIWLFVNFEIPDEVTINKFTMSRLELPNMIDDYQNRFVDIYPCHLGQANNSNFELTYKSGDVINLELIFKRD